MKRNTNSLFGFGMFIFMVILVIALLWFMVGWTDSNLDWLVSKISGQTKDVPTWISALVTFIGNWFALIFNIIIEILKLI